MKIFECKCGSKEIFIKDSGSNKGLYCADCGKWMQWLGKDDLRLAERQIEQSIVNPIPRNIDELKEHDAKVRAEVIEEIIEEMDYLNHQGGGLDDLLLYLNKMKEQKNV